MEDVDFKPEDQTEAAAYPKQEVAASEGDQEEMEADAVRTQLSRLSDWHGCPGAGAAC